MNVFRDEGNVRRFLTTPGPRGAPGPPGLRGARGRIGIMGWQGV